jgi:protein SCO1/2
MGTSARALLALVAAAVVPGAAGAAPPGSPWGERYFPNVELVTQDGAKVRFYDDLVKDKHVVVDFVFTSCTKQCGLMTANLARVQRQLGDRVGKDIFFYSITLDPERDTPEALKRYAKAFKAGPGWTFLTGKPEDIQLLRRKFGDLAPRDDHSASINVGNDAVGQWWHTGALDDPKYLATVIGSWMDTTPRPAPAARSYAEAPTRLPVPSRGERIFKSKCVMCHLADGESVGPALQGVVERRGRPWLSRWIKEPWRLVDEKDPVAVKLLARYGDVLMPTSELSDEDVAEVIRFLEKAGGSGQARARD